MNAHKATRRDEREIRGKDPQSGRRSQRVNSEVERGEEERTRRHRTQTMKQNRDYRNISISLSQNS